MVVMPLISCAARALGFPSFRSFFALFARMDGGYVSGKKMTRGTIAIQRKKCTRTTHRLGGYTSELGIAGERWILTVSQSVLQ